MAKALVLASAESADLNEVSGEKPTAPLDDGIGDPAIQDAVSIMEDQSRKSPELAEKQARLLRLLRNRAQ